MLTGLLKREKEANIEPDPNVEAYIKIEKEALNLYV